MCHSSGDALHCCRVTIVEAQGLLGTFDESLRAYALSKLHKQGVEIIEKVRSGF